MWTTLLKTTQWMIFCLSSKMDGTHGRTTFEDDPEQQLLRRAAHGNWHSGGASWEQNAIVGNVPTIISAWDSDPIGDRILQTQHVWKRRFATHIDKTMFRECQEIPDSSSLERKNESLQHKSTRWRCKIIGIWTTIGSSKTWAGFATYMWACCRRQEWSHCSLIIKHYRVQVRIHQQGFWSLYMH